MLSVKASSQALALLQGHPRAAEALADAIAQWAQSGVPNTPG
jgi:hypothetical protein